MSVVTLCPPPTNSLTHFNIYTKGGGILLMSPPDFTEDASDPNLDRNMGMRTTDLK
jgi:hypothetical protein